MKLVATTFFGLESVLAQEIEAIGGKHIEAGTRAVSFEGSKKTLYRANLELRTAVRVLQVIDEFKVFNEGQLYERVKAFNWPHYFDVEDTFAVSSVVNSYIFNHSQYVALKTKDAIVDRFRADLGSRPNVNLLTPKMRINIRIQDKKATLSLDSSGESLHKRGYRIQADKAPISEVLAAGMILLTGWKGERPFMDPMCGAATIPIEAGLIATRTPPNLFRKEFGFQKWKNFSAETWEAVLESAKEQIKSPDHPILASDKSFKAIRIAEENIEEAGLSDHIQLERQDFTKLIPNFENGMIIMNPPYDERLEKSNIEALYKAVGDQLKQHYQGFEAWMISSNMEALKKVGLRPSKKITLYNGPLECKYQKYELYGGSKKAKYQN